RLRIECVDENWRKDIQLNYEPSCVLDGPTQARIELERHGLTQVGAGGLELAPFPNRLWTKNRTLAIAFLEPWVEEGEE
ncbi:MAG: hypothetical protein WCO60_20180, partial [Verrucomicrobiota bacterium]